ncbi:MAG: hypothetical protein ACXVPL_11375, partial [Actinomycetota bacterium]
MPDTDACVPVDAFDDEPSVDPVVDPLPLFVVRVVVAEDIGVPEPVAARVAAAGVPESALA